MPFFLKALIHSVSRWNLIRLFQCGGLCENSKKKKIIIQRKKKEEKKKEKEKKCQKEENKKGSHQILRSEMEGRNTTLKKKSWKKKIVEWKFQKELTFRQILKTLLIIYLHPFLFHSLYFYPTLRPNKVLI